MFINCGESVAVQVYGTLLGNSKGRLVKAIVTVFSTLNSEPPVDNQVDAAVTDC